ncbi:MAG: LysM peptidoglycan-binding domain-containing protein [Bacteroidota bacterium]
MSLSCQYDTMRYPFFLSDLTRSIPVEGELRLAENLPPLAKINWGSFEVEGPELAVYDDLLVVSGKVYPYIIYLTSPSVKPIDSETDSGGLQEQEFERLECGARWTNEAAIGYEERITIPGLRPGMVIDVDLSPSNATFEQIGTGQIHFFGQLEARVHALDNQEIQVVSEVIAQPPSKVNVTKEPVKVEEVLDIRKETIPLQTPLVLSNLKPGTARILTYQARPAGVNYEVGRNKIFIKGFLDVAMVYVGCDDDGRPTEIFAHEWNRSSGTAVPFETVIAVDASDTDLTVIPRITLRNSKLEQKTPREMRYRVDVECEATISKIVQKEVVTDAESGGDQVVDVLKNLLNFEENLGEKTGVLTLETTIALPGGENPERLLLWEASPKGLSLEAAEDKVLVDGSMDLRLIYAADGPDGSRVQVGCWDRPSNTSIPLAGVIEFPGIHPGALLRAQAQVDSVNLELTGDRTVQVNATVLLRVMARAPRAMMTLRDCAAVEPVDLSTRPSMMFYVIQPGDSLWKIARQYQTTVETLVQANQIANPDRVYIGQKLLIPKQVV